MKREEPNARVGRMKNTRPRLSRLYFKIACAVNTYILVNATRRRSPTAGWLPDPCLIQDE